MSRFFATGATDSESSSESSDEEQKPVATKAAKSRAYVYVSSDEESEKRVVRSQKDKRYDELRSLIQALRNSQKIKDVSKVQTGFDTLQRAFQKAKGVIEKEGDTPRFYIRALMELEDFVKELWEDKKKLSKINGKSLGTLKQKVRKYNKDFEERIADYRENPIESEEEEEEERELESEGESEEEVVPTAAVSEPVKDEMSEGSDSDDSWGFTSESDSTESEPEGGRTATGGFSYSLEYFLKKDKDKDKSKDEVAKVKREPRRRPKEKEEVEEEKDDEGWTRVGPRKAGEMTLQEKKKSMFGKADVEVDAPMVGKKRNEIVTNRGKKTDLHDYMENLKVLMQICEGENLNIALQLRLLMDLIQAIFDVPSVAMAMKEDVWMSCLEYLAQMLSILETHPEVSVSETAYDVEENFTAPDKPYFLSGSLVVFIERLDEEYIKMLQDTDAHSTEYVRKLRNEVLVEELIQRVQSYMEERYLKKNPDLMCRIYIHRIEHLYFKINRTAPPKPTGQGEEEEGKKKEEEEEEEQNKEEDKKQEEEEGKTEKEDAFALMMKLTKYIYSCEGDSFGRIRTRAMLCHVYHHALHDRWFQAHDLMLMSHLQESIHLADVPTQILYNRALVQLGMCAFRHGMIKAAHDALVDIQSSGRSKELLAQGLIAKHDRTVEQEKLERKRQVPFHMHINLELMECCYLTAAMLLEVPYMAAAETEGRRRMISKSFHHQLKYHEKQPLVGPPESMREHVVAAAHAMKRGNWSACNDYIIKIKAWDLFLDVDRVKSMLTEKIKEESLKTFIFAFSEVYDSLSLVSLSDMFELPRKNIHSIVSKMIIREELLASLDEPTQTIMMHHAKPNYLQSQALLLSEKIGVVSEHNEELMKIKHAGPWNVEHGGAFPFRQNQPWQSKHRRGQNQQRS